MSTVTVVPETADLDATDAVREVVNGDRWSLFTQAFLRFRYGDGFSFARALAFQVVMTLIPGTIFVVALAARLGEGRLQASLRTMTESLAPGPAGDIILRVFEQGRDAASSGNLLAIGAGALAMLVSGVTAMSQLQRGASRIYGIDADRPTIKRYGLATLLTLTVGVLLTVAFIVVALGSSLSGSFSEGSARDLWRLVRWPVGIAVLSVAFAALFKAAPNRSQPSLSWLSIGGVVAVVLWFAVSVGLSFYLNASSVFGETYGPLAGVIGVMLWSQLSAIAILYGLSVDAQLEAIRAGQTEVRTGDAG
ncbi:MAG: YihY/virulence factor BrkB family protein [Acidimicrobiia bacterium]|nr:YihY/virulence factor BrkB family protein [Acidimicrobiia bacterium]